MKDLQRQQDILNKWQQDPIVRHHSFIDRKLWSKQEEILWAYRKYKRVAVKSGNTVGKSYLAADIVMDFLTTNYPSKVITTAPTWSQVEDILWKEIAVYYHNSKIPIQGDLLKTELRFNDEWFAVGLSVDQPVRLQGRHSPHLLVLIDEASGINPEIWDMVDALHPEKIVAIGNPLEISGRFYECFSSPLWHKMTISCRECVEWQNKNGVIPGLVTQEWINEQEQIHGKNSPYVLIHVDGEFPEQEEGALISRGWVERARQGLDLDGHEIEKEDEEENARLFACDVATKHGENETVFGYRYGHTIPYMKGYRHIPTNETSDKLAMEYNKRDLNNLVIDSDGIGEGVADTLRSKNVPHTEFHGGLKQKAVDSVRFFNLRSQFYWVIAKKFEKGMYDLRGISPEAYEILKNQLCSIQHSKRVDPLGRIKIESKEDMMARGIKSPDFSDTFMMMEYAFFMQRNSDIRPYSYR